MSEWMSDVGPAAHYVVLHSAPVAGVGAGAPGAIGSAATCFDQRAFCVVLRASRRTAQALHRRGAVWRVTPPVLASACSRTGAPCGGLACQPAHHSGAAGDQGGAAVAAPQFNLFKQSTALNGYESLGQLGIKLQGRRGSGVSTACPVGPPGTSLALFFALS
jgi:hypothetical protein